MLVITFIRFVLFNILFIVDIEVLGKMLRIFNLLIMKLIVSFLLLRFSMQRYKLMEQVVKRLTLYL